MCSHQPILNPTSRQISYCKGNWTLIVVNMIVMVYFCHNFKSFIILYQLYHVFYSFWRVYQRHVYQTIQTKICQLSLCTMKVNSCNFSQGTYLYDTFGRLISITNYSWFISGNMKNQIVGPISFRGMKLTVEELEYMLGKVSTLFLEASNFIW